MAPKKGAVDLKSPESVARLEQFESTGLSASRARNAAQSLKSSDALARFIEQFDLSKASPEDRLDEKKAGLVADLVTAAGYEQGVGKEGLSQFEVEHVLGQIRQGRLKSSDQVNGR